MTSLNIDNNSSDDEANANNDEQFVQNGGRGIVVFKAFCAKTERNKVFHLHLHSGHIHQYVDKKRKVFHVHDVISINHRPIEKKHYYFIDIKKHNDVSVRQKKYIFDDEEKGSQFKKALEFRKEYGSYRYLASTRP